MAIAGNKIHGIRAALCHDTFCAHQCVEHDDVNLLCLGAWIIGVKLAEIIDVSPELTAQEIERVADLYRSRHPTWPLTPAALCKHWSEFARATGPTKSAKTDIYVEPEGWRELAAKTWPNAMEWSNPHDFRTIPWLEVANTIREQLLAKLYPR